MQQANPVNTDAVEPLHVRSAIRAKLISSIAWLFRVIKPPANTNTLFDTPTVIITQSNSIIIEGLLTAIARNAFSPPISIQYWNGEDAETLRNENPSERRLYWCSLHDGAAIEKLTQHALALRTLNVFQVRGPTRDSPSYRYSFFWQLGLLPTRRLLVVSFGSEAISSEQTVSRLLRVLKVDFFRNLRMVRGNPFHSHAQQRRVILRGADFERELKVLAARNQISMEKARSLADAAFDELAAAPRRIMYDISSAIARVIINKLFGKIHTKGIDSLKALVREHTVVLIPMHRSHLDYVVIGDELYRANITPALIAAGINLSFWPMGFLFRSVGAYFVKRNARDRFHTIVLRRYVSYLVKRGHMQEFFIEGGRSRSGKMLPPKLGLLGVFIDAWKNKLRSDICFVPVSLSYEHLVEDETFGTENSGGKKVKEDFFSLVRAFDVFAKSYGEVTIEFGPPLFLNDFAERFPVNENKKVDIKKFTEELGKTLCRDIQAQISPTLSALVYLAIMTSPGYAVPANKLADKVFWLRSALLAVRQAGLRVGDFSKSLEPIDEINFESLLKAQIIEQGFFLGEAVYSVPGERRFRADFYKNAVAHYFIPLAIVVIKKSFGLDAISVERLYEMLKTEYLLSEIPALRDEMLAKAEAAYDTCKDDTANLRSLAMLILPSLEAVVYTADILQKKFIQDTEQERLVQADVLQELQDSFKSAQMMGFVSRTEVSSKSTLLVALDLLHQLGLLELREGAQQQKEIGWKGNNLEYVSLARTIAAQIKSAS